MNLKRTVIMAAAAGILVAGCATDPNRTFSQRWSDSRTTDRVEDALGSAPIYKYPAVTVTTVDGVVQLSGFVSIPQQKQEAEQIASGVPGVRQVINQISLRPELAPTGRATGAPGDSIEYENRRRGTSEELPRENYEQRE